jgi:hypothetical protein
VSGPKRPINIVTRMIHFPAEVNLGVIPMVKHVVEKADVASYKMAIKSNLDLFSVIVSKKATRITVPNEMIITDKARNTVVCIFSSALGETITLPFILFIATMLQP